MSGSKRLSPPSAKLDSCFAKMEFVMWKLTCTLLVLLITALAVAPAQQTAMGAGSRGLVDQEHTKWIDQVMRSMASVKPGMTRKDLFRVFSEEGGLSTRTRKRYVYKHCPYIKVDVEFSPVDDLAEGQDAMTENSEDRIVKISQPFLEYSIAD